MNKLYHRKTVDKILKYIDSQKIIVIHGSRQVGKTSIMKILIDKLLNKNIPGENIAYIDLEDFVLQDLFNKGVKVVIDYLNGLNIVTLQKTSTIPSAKDINNKNIKLIYPWEIKNLY